MALSSCCFQFSRPSATRSPNANRRFSQRSRANQSSQRVRAQSHWSRRTERHNSVACSLARFFHSLQACRALRHEDAVAGAVANTMFDSLLDEFQRFGVRRRVVELTRIRPVMMIIEFEAALEAEAIEQINGSSAIECGSSSRASGAAAMTATTTSSRSLIAPPSSIRWRHCALNRLKNSNE